MAFVQQLFLYLGFTSLIFLLAGMFKPWIMLWWEDVQNRKKVIKVYGTVAVVSFMVYFAFGYFVQASS